MDHGAQGSAPTLVLGGHHDPLSWDRRIAHARHACHVRQWQRTCGLTDTLESDIEAAKAFYPGDRSSHLTITTGGHDDLHALFCENLAAANPIDTFATMMMATFFGNEVQQRQHS